MNKIILIVLVLSSFLAKAQDNNCWTAFWNNDSTLIGFKDKHGNIKIEPKFVSFTTAKKFHNIIAVMEENMGSHKKYYLTKNGKQVGTDSIFIFDNASDCESEGYIRFKDKESELVGMFNKNGDVAIPAEYNTLSRVENGLIVALKGAQKKHGVIESGCDHCSWEGGTKYLINTHNKILIDNFEYVEFLNFYSLKIEPVPTKDLTRIEFKGLNGKYFSFIDYEKEFANKLDSFLRSDFTKADLEKFCYDSIYFWKDGVGWIAETSKKFMDVNFELIKDRLSQLNNKDADYTIFTQGLNPFIYESNHFDKYFNNCGEARESKYPVMNVVINTNIAGDLIQDHFDFLSTDNGYKLISTTVKTGETK